MIALTTDRSFLTAFAKGYGFEGVSEGQEGMVANPIACSSKFVRVATDQWYCGSKESTGTGRECHGFGRRGGVLTYLQENTAQRRVHPG